MALTSSSGGSHRRSVGCLYNRPFGWSLWVLRRGLWRVWGWRALVLLITILGKDTFSLVWRKSWKKPVFLSAVADTLKAVWCLTKPSKHQRRSKVPLLLSQTVKIVNFCQPISFCKHNAKLHWTEFSVYSMTYLVVFPLMKTWHETTILNYWEMKYVCGGRYSHVVV